MMQTTSLIIIAVLIVSTPACQNRNQNTAKLAPSVSTGAPVSPASSSAKVNHVTDQWLGRWLGPEGTYLLLAKKDVRFEVKIQSLDGLKTYIGLAAGDHIEFERDGKTESIHAGSGQATGMKWLLEKKDCLIIKQGEGFCRS